AVANDVLGLREIELAGDVLIRGAQAERVGRLESVFAADGRDTVAALAVEGAGLEMLLAKRCEAFGLIVRGEADEVVVAEAIAHIAAQVIALVRIVADLDPRILLRRESLGD